MTKNLKNLKTLVKKCRTELSVLQDKALLTYAWEMLLDKDDDGQSRGIHPYTAKAINALKIAYKDNPENIRISHHLAVAYHACAWDMELINDSQAAEFWRLALEFWRKVISSGEFWREMTAKMIQCDPEITENKAKTHTESIRKDLYENLLDVHVAFISHYYGSGCADRAAIHVDIVNTARIPPAVSHRLVKRVYEAMTQSVPEALDAVDYKSALDTVQHFLKLFPLYMNGLMTYMEISKNWIHSLSYKDDWDEIISLTKRIQPFVDSLISHDKLDNFPDVRIILADMTKEIMFHGYDRADSILSKNKTEIKVTERDDAAGALLTAINLGRLVYPLAPGGHEIRKLLPTCLRIHAFCINLKIGEIFGSKSQISPAIFKSTIIRLLKDAIDETEESLRYEPENDSAQKNLKVFQEELSLFQLQV